MHIPSSRLGAALLLGVGLAWFFLASGQDVVARKNPCSEYFFHHDYVIGTSLDVWMTAPDELTAAEAEGVILGEIERLRQIFSLYDPDSELSRLNRTREPMVVSVEMIDVLRQYDVWQSRSQGAFSGQLGDLVHVWKDAERAQVEPDDARLSRIVHQLRVPGWRIDEATHQVVRLTDQPLNLNSIAKGYIIQKAADAVRARVPTLQGLLLNLGGDMASWGRDDAEHLGFVVGIQDPRQPQDNAEPISRVRLEERSIATSGGYERYYTIQGRRYSHLFDPRTGRPAEGAASATVIARDSTTANALATTLCVLTPAEGLRLVAATPGAECLIIGRDGVQHRSAGFAGLEIPVAAVAAQGKEEKKADAWPEGYQVNLTLTIPNVPSKKYRRPYVAVWVENADAKPVRTVTVWGNNPRWIKDLPQWWKFAKNDAALVKAVSRATRAPGKYSLVWDGKDDKGISLPQGTYTIFVEVHREHGKLVRQVGKLTCGAEPAQITLEKNAETEATLIEYAKKK